MRSRLGEPFSRPGEERGRTAIASTLAAAVLSILALPVAGRQIPAELPDPDGKAPDTTKPVKVYILAGQSNMVGMGTISGARCRFAGIYLTADPAAPRGPLWVANDTIAGTEYKIGSCGIHPSAAPEAGSVATVSIYEGAHDPAKDYDEAKPAKTQTVALGVVREALPAIPGPHTHVARGSVDVPESGTYVVNPGYGESAYNVMELDGREVYRKEVGGRAVRREVALEAGKRYAFEITYFKGGSTAFWMRRLDLLGKGDLETVTKREKKFQHLIDDEGAWTVRNDVYFQEARLGFTGGPLTVGVTGRTFGPELAFGHVMGYYHDEQVLLIKTAQGNRALGWDFRPPSSGRTDEPEADKWEGLEYRLMIEGVRKTLDQIDRIVPGYAGQGYEIAGFVWWQGHKDGGSPEMIAEYERNLVNLIGDVRKEFQVPEMPVVVATVGFGGHEMNDRHLQILKAQMAVGDPNRHPEFAGNVRSVDTRDFWRGVDDSPANQDYHYHRNAETYLLVGDALGRAMVALKEGTKHEPASPARSTERRPVARQADREGADPSAAQAALAPIILDGMIPAFIAANRAALTSEANAEKPERVTPFLRDKMYALTELHRRAGIHAYDWHVFGPDLRDVEWHYFSFDPTETTPGDERGRGYRKVTYPEGMANWFAVDFDAAGAGWKSGLPPFGQYDGHLDKPSRGCTLPFCGCSDPLRSLWEKEVLLVRGTFEFPPFKEGHRYRIVVGGSAHVLTGEGYAIYMDGEKLIEYPSGVAIRQGGQPRGAFIDREFVEGFAGGEMTLAATSFLQYRRRGNPIPPQGHFNLWVEEMEIPPLGTEETAE
ncbi:MAG: hypothetical protein JXP34_28215 [Planctomycetes bacterium]|nr:hypothetical protein [Planctomycetota bacterium]